MDEGEHDGGFDRGHKQPADSESSDAAQEVEGSRRCLVIANHIILDRAVMHNATMDDNKSRIVHWHRQLPPVQAELVAEHTIEANSSRVPGTVGHRDELSR